MRVHIVTIEAENYRTFRHVRMAFHPQLNYLVGSHRIGKSNFLDLLHTLHTGTRFLATDFLDVRRPLRVRLTLQLKARHKLLTDGQPLADEDGFLHLEVTQRPDEELFTIVNVETGQPVDRIWLHRLRYVAHMPSQLGRTGMEPSRQAAYKRSIEGYFAERGEAALELLAELARRTGVRAEEVAQATAQTDDWLTYLHTGVPDERAAAQTFRMLLAAVFQLVTELAELRNRDSAFWENNLLIDERHRRYLPLVISIDEPEIHLHPFLQRSLLHFYRDIIANQSRLVTDLLSYFLGVDGLEGQLFIVTHSTDCLIDDYHYIMRLYRDDKGRVRAACGAEFSFAPDVEKHLVMHFPEIKEALYARSVLIVEGETEYGAFFEFGKSLGVHFDYVGISLINARGESSIARIAELFHRFGLGTVKLYDRDVREQVGEMPDTFFTEGPCFELDVVKHLLANRGLKELRSVVRLIGGSDGQVRREMATKAARKWKPNGNRYFGAKKLKNISGRDTDGLTFYYFAWLYSNKGVIVGRALGRILTAEMIPHSFRQAIARAAELAR